MLMFGICSCGNAAQSEGSEGILATTKQVTETQKKEATDVEKETPEMMVSTSKSEQEGT